MSVGSFTFGVSELLLGLCLVVLVLLIRFRGFGPAVLVAAVVSTTGAPWRSCPPSASPSPET